MNRRILFSLFVIPLSFTLYGQKKDTTIKKSVDSTIIKKDNQDGIIPAQFVGGQKAWLKFLNKKLRSNVPTKKGASPGIYKVVVQFEINTDGKVINIYALTNYGYGMEDELVRVIRLSPAWVPATQYGHNIKYAFRQDITFRVGL